MDQHRKIRDLVESQPSGPTDNSKRTDPADFGGTFRITEHHDIQIAAPRFGELEASLICNWEAQSGVIFTALKITFKGQDEYSSEYSTVITEDELLDLRRALAFLRDRKDQIVESARAYTEIKYEIDSGLILGTYIDGETVGEYCVVDSETVFLRSVDSLDNAFEEALLLTEKVKNNWKPC